MGTVHEIKFDMLLLEFVAKFSITFIFRNSYNLVLELLSDFGMFRFGNILMIYNL